MRDHKQPVSQTPDSVTLRRVDYEALLTELQEAEDRAKARSGAPELHTLADVDRLRASEG